METNNRGTTQTANILIVDDVKANLTVLSEMVRQAGYIARPVISVKQAMQAVDAFLPHLILLDITMPEIDGFEYCEMLRKDPRTKDIPVIFITGLTSTEDKIRGFKLGAVDFIVKPFEVEEVTMRIGTHLKNYRMQQELEVYNKRLYKLVNEQMKKIQQQQRGVIYAMAKLAEERDDATGSHLESVGKNSRTIAMSLQLSSKFEKQITNEFIETIELSAPLHDIGKIRISDSILLKPDKLTDEEKHIVEKHTEYGAKTLMEIYSMNEQNDLFKMAIDVAHYHHERWDGTGYPKGLKGTDIPLSARIVAVADVYDTLVNERCYKKAYSHEETMRILNEGSGTCFDPDIIEVVNKIQNQLIR